MMFTEGSLGNKTTYEIKGVANLLLASSAIMSICIILGWFLHRPELMGPIVGIVPKLNTAICVLVLSVAYLLSGGQKSNKISLAVSQLLILFAFALSILTLVEHFFNIDLGIDQVLVKDSLTTTGPYVPGRQGFNAAVMIALCAIAFFIRPFVLSFVLNALVVWLCVLCIAGYSYGFPEIYAASKFFHVGLPTSMNILLLSLGLLLLHADKGPLAVITRDGPGGKLARFLLPFGLACPFMGLLAGFGQHHADALFALVALLSLVFPATVIILTIKTESEWKARFFHYEATDSLAKCNSVKEAVRKVLQMFCMANDWQVGEYWQVEADTQKLYCAEYWAEESAKIHQFSIAAKLSALQKGEDLPGKIWQEERSFWIEDVSKDQTFARRKAAEDENIRAAFGLPIFYGKGIVGVMLFYSRRASRLDKELLELASSIGNQLGQFIERLKVSSQLEESNREISLLAAIVESTGDAIVGIDLNGKITSWNESAKNMFGFSKEEAIGQPSFIIIPEELLSEREDLLQRLVAGDQSTGYYETVRCAKDGSKISVSLTVSPIKDAAGNIVGASKIFRNIEAQKKIRLELEERAHLLDLAPDGIMVRDLEHRVLYWNNGAEELYGFSKEEALGKRSQDLLKTEFPLPLENIMNEIFSKKRWDGELIHHTKDGKPLSIYSRNTLKVDSKGQPLAVLAINTDIGARKKAEEMQRALAEDLKRSNEELAQFAAVASHDLQEPLRGVAGSLEIIEECLKDKQEEKISLLISHAVSGAARMHALIDDLLTLSRVTTKGRALEPTDLNEIVDIVKDNLEVSIGESGALITADKLPLISSDSTQLIQLFQNLLANAIKFRSEDVVKIHIGVEQRKDDWLFSVSDNGIGFDEEHAERIFLPFKRLHTRDKFPGTGIGLAICKRIVERHKGRIWCKPNLSGGTIFYFTIPC